MLRARLMQSKVFKGLQYTPARGVDCGERGVVRCCIGQAPPSCMVGMPSSVDGVKENVWFSSSSLASSRCCRRDKATNKGLCRQSYMHLQVKKARRDLRGPCLGKVCGLLIVAHDLY